MFVQACHLLILVLARPLTQTALSTFLVVLMYATPLTVENQTSGLQLRPLPVGLPFSQELNLNLNDRVLTCISPWLFLHVSFVYHVRNMIMRIIIEIKSS